MSQPHRAEASASPPGGCIYGNTCVNFPRCVCYALLLPMQADGRNVDRRTDPRSERQSELIAMYRAEV